MQSPTCTNLRIRSPSDVRVVFHAVLLELLPMVTRRLDSEERGLIVPGSVYVWEERGAHAEITGALNDGLMVSAGGLLGFGKDFSSITASFLETFPPQSYKFPRVEKAPSHFVFPGGIYPSHRQHATQDLLIKQTYTAFVDTPRGQCKWHLIAYFTEESLDRLHCIDDYPALSSLNVPHGKYKSARSVKGRPDHIFNPDDSTDSGEFSHLQYVAYDPGSVSSRSTPSPRYPPRSLTWNGAPSDRTDSRRQAEPGPIRGHIRGRSLPESESGILAPLAYLETVTPPRRHPVDETALKAFRAGP